MYWREINEEALKIDFADKILMIKCMDVHIFKITHRRFKKIINIKILTVV